MEIFMQNKKNSRQIIDYTSLIWSVAIALICFVAHILICKNTDADPALVGLLLLVAYIVAITMLAVSVYRYQKTKSSAEMQVSSSVNTLRDLLSQVNTPMTMTDGNGRILWCNESLSEKFIGENAVIGTSMYRFCNITEKKLLNDTETGGTVVIIGERSYLTTCFKVSSQIISRDDVREFYLTVFDDNTELVETLDRMERFLPAIAYIVVDNLEELAQYVKVSYRQATNEIESILKDWAGELNGVLREYDRDKYILLFSREKLNMCMEERFEILDKIRQVRLSDDETSMPITVSMGIAVGQPMKNEGAYDLVSIERDAASALDMALQRGGDQVAIKTENGLEYFGGKTKSMQKRTKVKARVIAGELCTRICNSSRVIVMGHKNPDFDSIGACVGVARLAIHCGVDCRIITDKANANFVVSTERLAASEEYENMFIDEASALDLLTPSTLLVIVDTNNFNIVEAPEVAANAKTIFIIDHHRQTDEMPETVVTPPYIDPAASSACELVSEILEQCVPAGTLQNDEANVMLAGIMVDTQNFTRSTSTRTFGAALYLRGEGANSEIARAFFNEDFGDYIAEAKFGGDVITYRGRIAITKSDGTGSPSDRIAAAKAADKLLTIRGIDASFALVDLGDSINISARSNGSINVQLLLEGLNGGGHFDAAGAQIGGVTMLEAVTRLKKAIDEYLDSNK